MEKNKRDFDFLNDRRKRVDYQLEWRSPQTRVVCPQWPRTVHTAGWPGKTEETGSKNHEQRKVSL